MPAEATTTTTRKKRTPEVVVFDGSSLSATSQRPKFEFKNFMSSKISKIDAKPAEQQSKADKKEDEESRQHDRELKELLEGRVMIEKLHESQLYGKDRHAHNTQKLARLGMKVKTKDNLPVNQYISTQRNREKKAAGMLQDAKDRGILNATLKREIEMKHLKKPGSSSGGNGGGKGGARGRPAHRSGDRGPKIGTGKFKDGILHISKSHIDRVNNSGKSQSRVSKSKGKGKGRGVSKGASKGGKRR
ncbi:hypothetical protein LPJ53_006057 [Coemansia erecta]|uniref:Uncharacterized protein n=1 Tax=Coemansia erecta TaxID=147472 RepID=A0A9W7XUV3_9FUNG|nr:hypothetical protein LPJ53_006057 [Coemansia erecta]